jgi:hypothetical protein
MYEWTIVIVFLGVFTEGEFFPPWKHRIRKLSRVITLKCKLSIGKIQRYNQNSEERIKYWSKRNTIGNSFIDTPRVKSTKIGNGNKIFSPVKDTYLLHGAESFLRS